MPLDRRTQGDARALLHPEVCKGYLPTLLSRGRERRRRGCGEDCQCWCHAIFTHFDGTEREDAEALRKEL